jgi:hypothetical protein
LLTLDRRPARNMQCARDDAIVGEHTLAGQQPRILDAPDVRPDALRPRPKTASVSHGR